MCPSCQGVFTAVGTGDSDRSTCPNCSNRFFAEVAIEMHKRYLAEHPPLPEGKEAWCKCTCGTCFTVTGDAETFRARCPDCKTVTLVPEGIKAHAGCKTNHTSYVMYSLSDTLKEPKTQEAKLRLELAKAGIKLPDGDRGQERLAVRQWQAAHEIEAPLPSDELRERWNAYQRSLPETQARLFIDCWANFGPVEAQGSRPSGQIYIRGPHDPR